MVTEVTTVGELAEAFRAKDEAFQSDLYEYTNDYMRIRARSKAGGLDHPPNVYVSVKLYDMYDALKDVDSISAEDIEEGEVSGPLAYLEKLLVQHTKADGVEYQFKTFEDGGAVTFDASLERLDE